VASPRIQNVLAWYGVNMSLSAVYQQTDSWKAWPWTDGHNIATTPKRHRRVPAEPARQVGERPLPRAARAPHRALAGGHGVAQGGQPRHRHGQQRPALQTVTGYRLRADGVSEYRVIDYPPNGGMWVAEEDLHRLLEGEFAVWADTIGFGGFDHNTVITISRQ
jgi:hypothetical protein